MGRALWGIVVNFVMYAVPGLAGAAVGWGVTLMLGAALAWRSPGRARVSARTVAGVYGRRPGARVGRHREPATVTGY